VNLVKPKVAVLGQGYVGLPLSIAAQTMGWQVIGIDINESRVIQLKEGLSYIEDVSDDELQLALKNGFSPSDDLHELRDCEIVVVCVPTPLSGDGTPDLAPLKAAAEAIAKYASPNTLIISESTSFPGTLRSFIPSVIKNLNSNSKFLYSVAPERVDPGNSKWSYRNTPRLISGLTQEATIKTLDFYSTFCDEVIVVSSPEVAEFSKLLENSFRQVNIALINELVPLARSLNLDIFEVIQAADSKPYGFMKFLPGVGVGGHCIPVDPMYLSWTAKQKGEMTSLIDAAQRVNDHMPLYVANLVEKRALNSKSEILVIGLSYKAGVADLRESASIKLIERLRSQFENVNWWDEEVGIWNNQLPVDLNIKFNVVVITQIVSNPEILEVISKADQVIDCTGHFKKLPNVEVF
jgi:UDP-N-acetyl-D-glucosamine dehydrogenase